MKNKAGLEAQLRSLFVLKKSDQDIALAIKYQKEKIQKFDQSQEQQHEDASRGGNLGTDKEEYLNKYPCFKLLIKRIIEEEESTQEKQTDIDKDIQKSKLQKYFQKMERLQLKRNQLN